MMLKNRYYRFSIVIPEIQKLILSVTLLICIISVQAQPNHLVRVTDVEFSPQQVLVGEPVQLSILVERPASVVIQEIILANGSGATLEKTVQNPVSEDVLIEGNAHQRVTYNYQLYMWRTGQVESSLIIRYVDATGNQGDLSYDLPPLSVESVLIESDLTWRLDFPELPTIKIEPVSQQMIIAISLVIMLGMLIMYLLYKRRKTSNNSKFSMDDARERLKEARNAPDERQKVIQMSRVLLYVLREKYGLQDQVTTLEEFNNMVTCSSVSFPDRLNNYFRNVFEAVEQAYYSNIPLSSITRSRVNENIRDIFIWIERP